MKKPTVHEFQRTLQAARERVLRTVVRTDEELATLEAHPAGALSEDVTTATAMAILSRLEGRERHELDEIAAAQARLESGVFGVCERCGKAIPLARLRALPITRSCLACEAARETAR
jgi:RNA polymerase-binding protein DksA